MCSLPVITVLLAASTEMDAVSNYTVSRVGSKYTASIMSHYSGYCYTVHFNNFITLLGVRQAAYTPPFNPPSAQ